MENLLLAQLHEALPQGMQVPSETQALYAWIEANGFYDDAGGRRRGYLYPQDRLQQSWSDDEREGGTDIVFFTDEPKNRDEELRYWFYGEDRELAAEIKQRLCVFAGSGSEGSMCALWLDDAGETKIVHMGSGSGSTMTCVLAKFTDILSDICGVLRAPSPQAQIRLLKFEPFACDARAAEMSVF